MPAEDEAGAAPSTKRRKKGKKRLAEGSRVLRNAGAESSANAFVQALRDGDAGGDYSKLVRVLRGMSPVAVDQQLQSMQVKRFVSHQGQFDCPVPCLAQRITEACCLWKWISSFSPCSYGPDPPPQPPVVVCVWRAPGWWCVCGGGGSFSIDVSLMAS